MEKLTEAEVQEIAARVANILRVNSKGVGELPIASSLDGVVSLPTIRKNQGIVEVLAVPIAMLQQVAISGAEESISAANGAAAAAVTAAESANEATTAAVTGAESANTAAAAAVTAAESAATAAGSANTAATETIAAKELAVQAITRLNELSDHRDIVINGYWWTWKEGEGRYENTGEIAKGNIMYATFDIDHMAGELHMFTDEEYTGANFSLNGNGELIVNMS
jgi:hypothetical protein